ncbi:MAG: glycosyltransferase [Flavobacteriales bacterium]|nr:glycosyltransferase [Flavobacteriales bacterium]
MNKKRIVIMVSNDLVTDQRMHRICTSLSGSGYEVRIIGRFLKSSVELTEKQYAQTRMKLFFDHGVLFYLELNIRFILKLFFGKIDLLYSVDADTLPSAIILKFLKRLKLVYDAHELFPEVPELLNRPVKKWMWQLVDKAGIVYCSDLRFTVSETLSEHYRKKYDRDFIVLRNLPTYHDNAMETVEEKYVLYQGALNEGRGLTELIDAAKKIDMKILIAGDGDLRDELKSKCEKEEGLNKVIFLGKLDPEKLKEYTRRAFIGYNLLDNRSLSYYYSLSNKTFDYLHAGVPQLFPPFPEYIELNKKVKLGLQVDLKTDEIAKALDQLLKDPVLHSELKKGLLESAQDFDWNKEQKILLDAIKKLF